MLSTPQRQDSNGKIEVVEFFSWCCPHCYEFYPKLSRWLSTLPEDASFRRVPVGLGHPEWEALAKAFYALPVTGDVDRLNAPKTSIRTTCGSTMNRASRPGLKSTE